MPDCDNSLVHKSGTMIGKVAHIHAAEKGGTRFEEGMSNEDRRSIENLFIVCAACHDVIDNKANEKTYSARKLKAYKKKHEDRFRKAELQFIEKYADLTQQAAPNVPKSLKRLSEVIGVRELYKAKDEIDGIREFIGKLRELPLNQRRFALSVAERMKRRGVETLPIDDVALAFGIGHTKLKANMDLIEHHLLGSVDKDFQPGKYVVRLWDRKPAGNPWVEILEFCEQSGDDPEEFIIDLNFLLYDKK